MGRQAGRPIAQEVGVRCAAIDGAHELAVVDFRFPDGTVAPYVRIRETHGPLIERWFAVSTLVHLAVNVHDDEVWDIGNREHVFTEQESDGRSPWQIQQHAALETFSVPHAEEARRSFRTVKARQLALVAAEQRTKRQAIDTMRGAFEKLSRDYLKIIGTTYAVWETHGPKAEWEEVIEAARFDHVWERLLERGLAPWEGSRGG